MLLPHFINSWWLACTFELPKMVKLGAPRTYPHQWPSSPMYHRTTYTKRAWWITQQTQLRTSSLPHLAIKLAARTLIWAVSVEHGNTRGSEWGGGCIGATSPTIWWCNATTGTVRKAGRQRRSRWGAYQWRQTPSILFKCIALCGCVLHIVFLAGLRLLTKMECAVQDAAVRWATFP